MRISSLFWLLFYFFFFNDTATTEIYTLSLHDALPISRDLARSPYDRLLGVLQMLVRVCSVHGFEPAGCVILTAQKMRLLHAGIRTIVPRHRPGYEQRYGVPVNHEDMLATI